MVVLTAWHDLVMTDEGGLPASRYSSPRVLVLGVLMKQVLECVLMYAIIYCPRLMGHSHLSIALGHLLREKSQNQ